MNIEYSQNHFEKGERKREFSDGNYPNQDRVYAQVYSVTTKLWYNYYELIKLFQNVIGENFV
jgi:hypothetical protein